MRPSTARASRSRAARLPPGISSTGGWCGRSRLLCRCTRAIGSSVPRRRRCCRRSRGRESGCWHRPRTTCVGSNRLCPEPSWEFQPACVCFPQQRVKQAATCGPHHQEDSMQIVRREFLCLTGLAAAVPAVSNVALAQAQAGPKLTQILRKDLEGQGQVVQETVVSIVEFASGTAAPWHVHPGAQELL